MSKKITSAFILIVTSSFLFAQVPSDNPLKSRLDSVVDRAAKIYLKENKRVGISLGFVVNNESYIYNYGETAPGTNIPPTAQSIYEIGSITKTFTGLLVAHAVNDGKMKFTDDVRKFLPGNFSNLQYPSGDPVKVIYLLAHVAKFPNSFKDESRTLATEESFLKGLNEIKLDSLKGFKYAYSNVGYQLLGYILERVYGMPYQDIIQKYITKPLKMAHTKINLSTTDQMQVLNGYTATKERAPAIGTSFPGAGRLRSTVTDMLNYLKYQLIEGNPMVKLSHRITSGDIDGDAHAFQWAVGKLWNWDYYIRTDGGTEGFRSFCMLYPDYKTGFIVLSNETDGQAGGDMYRLTATIFNELKRTRF